MILVGIDCRDIMNERLIDFIRSRRGGWLEIRNLFELLWVVYVLGIRYFRRRKV